jgi:RNA polymerase sigma-70 factor, ECF subfamily
MAEITSGEPVEHPSDRLLLQRFRKGHDEASTLLYLRYARRLRALAAARTPRELSPRIDPEDIVQCVFRTFFRKAALGQYRAPDGEEIWGLLLVLALNQIRSARAHHRAAKRDVRATAGSEALDRMNEAPAGADETALSVLRLVIDQVLETLPRRHRQIIELRIEGHEVADIARETGCSKRSVERVLQRFRDRLGASLREDE